MTPGMGYHGWRRRWTRLGGMVGIVAGCVNASDGQVLESTSQLSKVSADGDAAVVVGWNQLAYEIAYAEDQFLTFKGQRALVLMNLAMHDALNTVIPKYERYAYHAHARAAQAELAAAQAACEVLRAQYPNAAARLDSALALVVMQVEPGERATALDLGSAAATAILGARAADGWDLTGSYVFASGPGAYQTTPDWQGFVLQPGFRHARPFALRAPDGFRPPPPPPLRSTRYARDYNEVRRFGSLASTARTSDQSAYATWWLEFVEGSVTRLARLLATERSLGLWEAARMFAQLHVALYDGYVATWDAKYEYNHWRPYTAIRAADDGNAKTESDAAWQSLRPAPPFPEYVSAHAVACAAAFSVLASTWPNQEAFTMTTITAPPEAPQRSFASFRAAAAECADSRVRIGWHFRYSTEAGLQLGERIARHIVQTQLRPTAN